MQRQRSIDVVIVGPNISRQNVRWRVDSIILRSSRNNVLVALLTAAVVTSCGPGGETARDRYNDRAPSDSSGTGRYYMGREIAAVIDHASISDWLERPAREDSELPGRLILGLELKPAMLVADIGAGTGYLTFRIALEVPHGRVFAVDIQQEMLDVVSHRRDSLELRNVETVLGEEANPMLPEEQLDMALMVGAYHEFYYPFEMMTNVVKSIKPGGRVVLVEYRGEDATIDVPDTHRFTREQAVTEMEAVGLRFRESKDILPQQHFLIFEKPIG